jgi:hypothetical protein
MRKITGTAAAGAGRLAFGAVLAASVACAVLVAAPTVVGTGSVAAAAPLVKATCSARSVSGSTGLRLKLEMAKSGEVKVPMVPVCVNGEGPFRFVVSTGAGSSIISPALARSLHLHEGSAVPLRGVTCVASAPTAAVASWSMSGLKLAPQTLLVAKVPRDRLSPAPEGIIGSDVLARFGAVRIDYRSGRLVLLGSEGALPKGNVYVVGQATTSVPSALAAGAVKASAPLRVFESSQGILVAAEVKIAGHTAQLAVDSGSSVSGVVPKSLKTLRLEKNGPRLAVPGVGCTGEGASYSSGKWSLGTTSLRKSQLVSMRITGSVNAGLEGVLGSDVLGFGGSVIVDYTGAHLWLTKA